MPKSSPSVAPVLQILERAKNEHEGWSCPSSAECCHFERTGREPWVTAGEWAVLERELARTGRRLSSLRDDGACPFLGEDDRCLVYEARPLGCRTFYCGLASGPRVPRSQLNVLVRGLEDASRDLGASGEGRPLRSWWRQSVSSGRGMSIRSSAKRHGGRR